MPINAPHPKPEGQKVTRHPLVHDWIDIAAIPYAGERPSPGRLPAASKRWWEVVTTLPHCVLWDAGDWQFAVDTARIHAAFSKGQLQRSQELRLRERVMGTTSDARRDLRIRYVDPVGQEEPEIPDNVTALRDDRRQRLLGSD